jgi:hypothetical protein
MAQTLDERFLEHLGHAEEKLNRSITLMTSGRNILQQHMDSDPID